MKKLIVGIGLIGLVSGCAQINHEINNATNIGNYFSVPHANEYSKKEVYRKEVEMKGGKYK